MQHLRIAMVSLHTSPLASPGDSDAGGMNVVVLAQAKALAAAGHDVTIFTRRSDDAADVVSVDGAPLAVRYLPAGPPTALPKSEIDQHIPEFAAALRDAVAQLDGSGRKPHLLHSHHWMSGIAALDVARQFGIPHLQSFHSIAATGHDQELSKGEPPESPARVPGEARCAQESDLIVAVSRAEARTAIRRLGADPARVTVVRPGVDPSVFFPADQHAQPAYLVAAARLQPLKGVDLAIESLPHVAADLRPRLLVAGAGSADFADYESELRRLVADLGLDKQVEFVGAKGRAELADLLRGATLALVPSHSETYGLIALESAACGAPVLAWKAGGLVEAVRDGESGLLLESRDPAEWGATIEALLRDEARLARLREDAVAHAAERTWDQSARELAECYWGAVDPSLWLPEGDGPVVFLHAHPDDETIQTGALIRHLTAAGQRVDLLTATRGERGGVVPGPLSHLEGTPELETHRRGELGRAISHLGIAEHRFLGAPPARAADEPPRRYRDSGMRWITDHLAGPAEDAEADAFTSASVEEAADDVAAYLRAVGARALISYDSFGTYGHPDHVRCHEVAALAAALAGVPLYEVLSPEVNQQAAGGGEAAEGETVLMRLGQHRGALVEALLAHASQVSVDEEAGEIVHTGGQREPIEVSAGIRRVR